MIHIYRRTVAWITYCCRVDINALVAVHVVVNLRLRLHMIFMNAIFVLFDIMCKLHHRATLNPFLTGTPVILTVCVNGSYGIKGVK